MAQQTQIERVDDAWVDFMQRFPTPSALAEASGGDVLRAWAGLGYNRRAVNLHRAAAIIIAEHDGRVPRDPAILESLPGIGPYTARAVAAIAFGQRVAPVDTNVRRLVSRLLGVPLTARDTQAEADALVARNDPATWTHASMELGATVCQARRPRCPACPVRRWCASGHRLEAPAPGPGVGPDHVRPFEQTTRWLRGRIVARLRALDDGDWARLPSRIGSHDAEAIAAAVAGLERDGLLERDRDGSLRLPSAVP